jgi:molybdate transport system regulatory protein
MTWKWQRDMRNKKNREDISALLPALSAADRAWLRQQLARHDSRILLEARGRLGQSELLAAESWLWGRVGEARRPREKQSRLRMWMIFMLLRYAGLRLVEVFAMRRSHFDLQEGLIRVAAGNRAAHQREVPLPLTVCRRLGRVLEDPTLFSAEREFLRCDSSYVRRYLQQCASACGLPKGLLGARALRQNRALELSHQGLPLPVIDIFLGRHASPSQAGLVRCDYEKACRLLREQLQKERPMRTSARNVFQGRIVRLRSSGLLVEVVLRTAGNLSVVALITDESFKNLELQKGKLVNASVKAPWILVQAGELPASAPPPAENCYSGVVERVREDDVVAEILVALSDGSQICALHSRSVENPVELQAGQKVTVFFKALSVILNLD